jgi:hypothetical protein
METKVGASEEIKMRASSHLAPRARPSAHQVSSTSFTPPIYARLAVVDTLVIGHTKTDAKASWTKEQADFEACGRFTIKPSVSREW